MWQSHCTTTLYILARFLYVKHVNPSPSTGPKIEKASYENI